MSAPAAAEVWQRRRVTPKDSALLALPSRNKHFNGARTRRCFWVRRIRGVPRTEETERFLRPRKSGQTTFCFYYRSDQNPPSFAAALIKYFGDEC